MNPQYPINLLDDAKLPVNILLSRKFPNASSCRSISCVTPPCTTDSVNTNDPGLILSPTSKYGNVNTEQDIFNRFSVLFSLACSKVNAGSYGRL